MAKKAQKKTVAKGKLKKPTKPPMDWVAVLKTGADGVKKWNKLTFAQRNEVNLSRDDFAKCDLSGINLKDMVIKSFRAAGAKFVGAKLVGTEFTKGQLAGADFTNADMQFITVMNADLRGAKLVGAKLRESLLFCANLVDADLTRANLSHADRGVRT